MKQKLLLINTPQGQYTLPLKLIAENRADYYGEKDGFTKDSKDYNEEVDFVMDDTYECIDWLLNNTDWDEWKDQATKINDKVKVSDDDFWTSSDDVEIIEK